MNEVKVKEELDNEDLLNFDRKHVWHPYTSMSKPLPVYPVESASGVKIKLKNGQELIDGMSSWWTAIHGYNHPVLNEAIIEQSGQMSHVMFGGITHEPATLLAQNLVRLTPSGLNKVFFSDSGSVSVEVAMKMAFQYWQSKGKSKKNKLLTFKKGYHGDTLGAMSVCDPENGMHHLFNEVLNKHFFAKEIPNGFKKDFDESHLDDFKNLLSENHESLAAVILEPIVQGAGGMRIWNPQYLRRIQNMCKEYDVLLILDEIATGFGRTGKMFAAEHAYISPDIMCVGKALTGGYMTLAATLCSDDIAITISRGEAGVFMHGPTYMGNPLACAVANASIKLLESGPWEQRVLSIEKQLGQELEALINHPQVEDVRVLGAIGVVEMKEEVNVAELQKAFISSGVWIRPFRNLIYVMPPYIISDLELSTLCSAIIDSINNDF